MVQERKRRIEAVTLEALARGEAERAAYLEATCAGDAALRREVESLLAGQGEAAVLLESPPWAAPAAPPLAAGTRLGPYELDAVIGAGGMGEVYKGRDTRLGRTVAIKVLPRVLAADPERRRRFEQEARAVSALNHPHICPLFDIGEAVVPNPESRYPSPEPLHYLVLAHLEGQTLAERLQKGALPVAHVLDLGAQMADALSAAHKAGIVHRDLKPANVMLTKAPAGATGPSGLHATLLDFGLAKLTGHGERSALDADGVTASASLTERGMVLGTVPYMAPEQVEGKGADARTDLWALGAVLYEMLTGRRAFEGETPTKVAAAILEHEPALLASLQPQTPAALSHVITKCLAKDPDARWDSAHDVAEELRWLAATPRATAQADTLAPRHRALRIVLIAAGVLAAALAGAALIWLVRPGSPRQAGLVQIPAHPADEVTTRLIAERTYLNGVAGGGRNALAWTPDGNTLLYIGMRNGVRRIYVRRLDEEGGAREIEGTDGATALAASPDGRSVAFIWSCAEVAPASDRPLVKVVALDGSPPVTIGRTSSNIPPLGIAWRQRDEIVFSDNRLWRVSANANSTPTGITPPDPSMDRELVALLPGGDVVLFDERPPDTYLRQVQVSAWRISTGERKVLIPKAADARYVPTGHLVYLGERETLMAVAFDAERLEVVGSAEPMLAKVSQAVWGFTSYERGLAGQFAIAPRTGHLAYLPAYTAVPPATARLLQVDRRGYGRALPGVPREIVVYPVRHVPGRPGSLSIVLSGGYLKLFDRGGRLLPLSGPESRYYAWSPDGQRLATLEDQRLVLRKNDGSDPHVVPGGDAMNPSSWSPDGRYLLTSRESDGDIYSLSMADLNWRRLIETPPGIIAQHPEVSPDGRWLAYTQDSGAPDSADVWLQRFPGLGRNTMVSVKGGGSPAWNPRGGELFFIARPEPNRADPDYVRHLMVADVIETPSDIEFGTPRPLFDTRRTYIDGKAEKPYWPLFGTRGFEVAPDGQSFLVVLQDPSPIAPPVTHINVIYNWTERLKTKVHGK